VLGRLILRFLLGGTIVGAFALAGELFEPKRFSGMAGAAPSVALATLALAFADHGGDYVAVEGRSTVIGAVALLACCATCVVSAKARAIPIWLTALAGWAVWFVVAFGLWAAGSAAGVPR